MRRWIERQLERERQRPRTAIDHWLMKQREIVLRLPQWLIGSTLVGATALGIAWAVTRRGLWPAFAWLFEDEVWAFMGTVAFTIWPMMIALYVVARFMPPRSS